METTIEIRKAYRPYDIPGDLFVPAGEVTVDIIFNNRLQENWDYIIKAVAENGYRGNLFLTSQRTINSIHVIIEDSKNYEVTWV